MTVACHGDERRGQYRDSRAGTPPATLRGTAAKGEPPMTVSTAPRLSPREREVLCLIAEGCTYLQVARRIGISTHTVSTYLRRIREKTEAQTLAELVRLALTLAL